MHNIKFLYIRNVGISDIVTICNLNHKIKLYDEIFFNSYLNLRPDLHFLNVMSAITIDFFFL